MTDPTRDPVEDLPHQPMRDALTRDEVDVYLDAVDRDGQEETDQRYRRWHPTDDPSAEWAMAQVVSARGAIAAEEAKAAAWAERIAETVARNTRDARRRLAYFTAELEQYALAWKADDPRHRTTLALPSGDLATTTPKTPTVQIDDAVALRVWLMTQASTGDERVTDDVLKPPTLPTPMVSGLRKLVTVVEKDGGHVAVDPQSGEIVPGVRVDPPGPTTVKVKPNTSA